MKCEICNKETAITIPIFIGHGGKEGCGECYTAAMIRLLDSGKNRKLTKIEDMPLRFENKE